MRSSAFWGECSVVMTVLSSTLTIDIISEDETP